jgi:hypothetical protein
MTDKHMPTPAPRNASHPKTDDWKTADDPMTDAQRAHLKTLNGSTGGSLDETLTQAEARERIDELKARTDTAPPPDGPLESLGKSVSEAVLGSKPDGADPKRHRGR